MVSFGSSKSESRELTDAEREQLYRASLRNMAETLGPNYFRQSGPLGLYQWSMKNGLDSREGSTQAQYQQYRDSLGGSKTTGWTGNAGNTNNGAMGFPKDWSRPGEAMADTLSVGRPDIGMPTGTEDAIAFNAPQYQNQEFKSFDYSKIAPYINTAYVKPGTTDWAGYNPAGYTAAPSYINPENLRSLTGGDYNALENSIYGARTAGLDRQRAEDLKAQEESLAARGIWSSGLAERDANDLRSKYADTYDRARGEAQQLRYNTQLAEQQALNTQDTTRNQNANTYGLETNKTQNAFNQALNAIMLDKLKAESDNKLSVSNAENTYNLSAADKQMAYANAQAQQLQNQNKFNQDDAQLAYQSAWQPLNYLMNLWNATKGQVSGSNGFNFGIGGVGGGSSSGGKA